MGVSAVGHVDAVGADGHADSVRLVVDGDDAEVGVLFALVHLLGGDQLPVDHDTFRRREEDITSLEPLDLCIYGCYMTVR